MSVVRISTSITEVRDMTTLQIIDVLIMRKPFITLMNDINDTVLTTALAVTYEGLGPLIFGIVYAVLGLCTTVDALKDVRLDYMRLKALANNQGLLVFLIYYILQEVWLCSRF